MHRQHDDRGPRPLFLELARRLEPVHVRHLDVHEHDVGQLAACNFQGFAPGARLGDHLDIARTVKHRGDALSNEFVVVHEQDTGHPAIVPTN